MYEGEGLGAHFGNLSPHRKFNQDVTLIKALTQSCLIPMSHDTNPRKFLQEATVWGVLLRLDKDIEEIDFEAVFTALKMQQIIENKTPHHRKLTDNGDLQCARCAVHS